MKKWRPEKTEEGTELEEEAEKMTPKQKQV